MAIVERLERRSRGASHAAPVDLKKLEADLKREIRGEVRFDAGSCALYSTDGSNYRQVPLGVVVPRTLDDVVTIHQIASRHGAPITSRGGGTSLAGQTTNTAIVVDHSKYLDEIEWLDEQGRYAWVQPGVVLDKLRQRAHAFDLTYAPDPATHSHCTFGGMLGNNSCGIHSVYGGRTDDNTLELDVVTYEGDRLRLVPLSEEERRKVISGGGTKGRIVADLERFVSRYDPLIRKTFPEIPRRVSGYNLPWLLPDRGFDIPKALVGSEGTLVTILRARMRLLAYPRHKVLVVLGYPDVYQAADAVPEILRFGPKALEGIDEDLALDIERTHLQVENLKYLPAGKGWLLVEFGDADRQVAEHQAQRMAAALRAKGPKAPKIRFYDDPVEEAAVWKIRESGLGATAKIPGQPDSFPGWEDSAVPPGREGEYLRKLRGLLNKYGYRCALYGHFGQGCIHTRIDFDLKTEDGTRQYRRFVREAAELVVSLGGSLSGEHGDGQSRAELLPLMFGDEMVRGFGEFKRIWDPRGKMNPGKLVDAFPLTENLRWGPGYNPPDPRTHFAFPDDHGSFAYAANRCVGVGNCRQLSGGTMCPSYMATHEEEHCTRGRARLLFEMLQGNPLTEGWKSDPVHEALDLCLSCKGCKGECPVHVDMATYKAEFLSHFYEGRLRPRHMYAFGSIPYWSRLAGHFPKLVNYVTQTPGLAALAKLATNVHPQRRIPAMAPEPFHVWFARRQTDPRGAGSGSAAASAMDGEAPLPRGVRGKAVLWPDTFNNYFMPHTAKAAVEVLEAAGFEVALPPRLFCCGRPLYDYGFVEAAKKLLENILAGLGDAIHDGDPIVFLEPSCCSVLRDELVNLLPLDPRAKALSSHTFTLAEFLVKHAPDWKPPRLHRKAIVHGHCHHKSVLKMTDDTKLLDALFGADYEVLDTSCCGMAGAFGFERDHHEISLELADHVLLPAIRAAGDDVLVISDGFSCREQIMQTSDRRALHLAEVLQLAIHPGLAPPVERPEEGLLPPRPGGLGWRTAATAGVIALAAGAAALALRGSKNGPDR